MSRFDAIVIGGGLNGLVAGAVLARADKSVCILEQSQRLGGLAAPGSGKAPGLAHLLYNLSPRVRREIGMGRDRWPFQMADLQTVSLCESGRHVVVRGRQARYTDGTEHPHAEAFDALMVRLQSYGTRLRHLAEGPPPGGDHTAMWRELWRLGRFGLGLKRMGKAEMRSFLRVLLSNAYDLILDEMPDGPLAGILAADAVRGAAAGPRSPGTVFSLIYRMGHGGQASLPLGGIGAVSDAFATAATRAGCVLRTGTRVTRILTEADAVTGVETAGGETITAPLVLTSTGAAAACAMAGPAAFDIEATRRLRNIRARGTTAKINLRLDRVPEIPGLPDDLMGARMILAPSAETVECAFTPAKYGEMSENPVIEAVLPGLTDTTQSEIWLSAIVQYAPCDLKGGWTAAARDRLLKQTVNTLARVAPQLPDCVSDAQVITPDQIEAMTGAPGGHWHHAEMSLDQLLTLRPANGLGHYALGPRGLYLCGASAHPGGDLMGLAGRNAARAALERQA
jgi:phytoene dehydrogenase-like protein